MREAGPYLHLGVQVFAAILLFSGGGYWLDRQFGTLPLLTLVGTVVAFVAIIGLLLQVAGEAGSKQEETKASKDGPLDSTGPSADGGS